MQLLSSDPSGAFVDLTHDAGSTTTTDLMARRTPSGRPDLRSDGAMSPKEYER